MSGHRVCMWWRDRWASSELHSLKFSGSDQDILRLLDRHDEVEDCPLVTIVVDQPDERALDALRWEAWLRADGERAIVMTNGGNWFVGVEPGSEGRHGVVEFTDPRGTVRTETGDVVIQRELAFRAIKAWLRGSESVDGLDWDLHRNRGHQ